MKNCILVILLFCVNTCWGNAIDSIKTKRDVITFLDKYLPDRYYDRDEDDTVEYTQKWIFFNNDNRAADSFYIVDLDRNGHNDLVIDGRSFYIILDLGRNYKKLTLYGANYTYHGIRKADSTNYLLVHVEDFDGHTTIHTHDTALIYKWDEMVEHVPSPAKYSIDNIEFAYSNGHPTSCGELAELKAIIHKDGKATYYYQKFCTQKSFKTEVTLPLAKVQHLHDMMNYMHFASLPGELGRFPFHSSTFLVKMYYNNGQVKKLKHGHGYHPLSLSALYSEVFDSFQQLQITTEVPLTEAEERAMLMED